MFDFWLDYKVFPYDNYFPFMLLLWNISGFNILKSEEESLPNPFSSDLHITDPEKTNRVSKYNLKCIYPIYNDNYPFLVTFMKTKRDLTSFHPLLNPPWKAILVGETNITCNTVDLLARNHFAFLWGSKNIMLEGEIIELSLCLLDPVLMPVWCYEISGILCGVSIELCRCFVLPVVQIPGNWLQFLTESTELNLKKKTNKTTPPKPQINNNKKNPNPKNAKNPTKPNNFLNT